MTSRTLFFKLMREDMKHKLWAFGLALLSFFFWIPVAAAMRIGDLLQQYERWIANGTTFGIGVTAEMRFQERLMSITLDTVGMSNILNGLTIGTAAIVMALTGFMYVHSRKQMDFYHSVPVRRELIFAAKFINGIIAVFSMYVLNLLFAIGVLAVNGVELSVLLPMGFMTFMVHVGGYLMLYGLMTIAVMLTGNFFVSILGGIVLFAYLPAAIALIETMQSLFFETFNARGTDIEGILLNSSPVSYYVKILSTGVEFGSAVEKYGTLWKEIGIAVLVGMIMAVITMFLYKKRPSESAGKAMAFRITKAPIEILMEIAITVCVSLLCWNIYYSVLWAVFGFVLGLVVYHCIIEIIYHFEFRKLFSNLQNMAISAVVSLALIGVFRFDLIGYDSYLPEEENVVSASICANNLEDWYEYGLPYMGETGNYGWSYIMENEYVAGNMKVTDYELISALGKAGIANAKTTKENKYSSPEDYGLEEGYWTSLEVGYELKNGKKVYRNYRVSVTGMKEQFDRLYASSEYKSGVNPVMSYTMDNITGIYEARRDEIQEVKADASAQAAILDAYKEEYTALTLEERTKESPITSLRFLTVAEYDYLKRLSTDRSPNYTGDFRIEDMNNVNFFPVYPSFTKTITLLKQAGVEDFGPVDVDDVLFLEIYSDYYEEVYSDYEAEMAEVTVAYPATAVGGERVLTLENDGDPENISKMKEVLDNSVDLALIRKNGLQPVEYGISVRVYMKDANEGKSIAEREFVGYVFPADKIPEFVEEAFQLDQIEGRNIATGLVYVAQ